MKRQEKGILIVATGHSHYGRMAYNLAVSIKANEETAIALVYNSDAISHLDKWQMEVFDYAIEAHGMPIGTAAKLDAYNYTPFEKTLLLDADMIWLPNRLPSQIFDYFDSIDFTCIAEGTSDKPSGHYYFWADMDEIKKVYGIEMMYQFRSEVMYFRKCKEVKKFFDDAKKIYANPRLTTIRQHAGTVPDELAMNISAAKNDIHPHQLGWSPSYWFQLNGMLMPDAITLSRTYFLASMGGHMAPNVVKKFYNTLMLGYLTKSGRNTGYFQLESKRDLIKARKQN